MQYGKNIGGLLKTFTLIPYVNTPSSVLLSRTSGSKPVSNKDYYIDVIFLRESPNLGG